MALETTIVTNAGIEVVNAYCRVEQLNVKKKKLYFSVFYYVSPDHPFFDDERMVLDYDMDGANPWVQAYEYLKTLPKFENSTDV